jgi:hypothetical protein
VTSTSLIADSKVAEPVFSELLHARIGGNKYGGQSGWSSQMSRKPAPKRSEDDLKRIIQAASSLDNELDVNTSRKNGGGLDDEFAAFMGVKRK